MASDVRDGSQEADKVLKEAEILVGELSKTLSRLREVLADQSEGGDDDRPV